MMKLQSCRTKGSRMMYPTRGGGRAIAAPRRGQGCAERPGALRRALGFWGRVPTHLGYVGMVVNAYDTLPPEKTSWHMAASSLMMGRCSHRLSPWTRRHGRQRPHAAARSAGASARMQARHPCAPQRETEGPGAAQLLSCSVTSSGGRTGTQSELGRL